MGHDYPIEGADNSLFPPMVGCLTGRVTLEGAWVISGPGMVCLGGRQTLAAKIQAAARVIGAISMTGDTFGKPSLNTFQDLHLPVGGLLQGSRWDNPRRGRQGSDPNRLEQEDEQTPTAR